MTDKKEGKKPSIVQFCDKNGHVFAEYTLETLKTDKTFFPDEIRKKLTQSAINGGRLFGYEPRKSDLEKYGVSPDS